MNFYFLNLSYFDRLRDKDCIIQTASYMWLIRDKRELNSN